MRTPLLLRSSLLYGVIPVPVLDHGRYFSRNGGAFDTKHFVYLFHLRRLFHRDTQTSSVAFVSYYYRRFAEQCLPDSLHAHLVLLLKKQSLLKLPHHRKGYVAERYMAAYPGFRPMIHRTDLKVALRYAEALFLVSMPLSAATTPPLSS